ncbi:MAG TPA: hypothetical protein VGE52_17450 [Pirellulales bacterium]
MSRMLKWLAAPSLALLCNVGIAPAADAPQGLDQKGKPDVKSIGPLAFGPDGVLFLGDPRGAAIFAVEAPTASSAVDANFKIEGIDAQVAALLGVSAGDVLINDLAVQPGSGQAFLSVSRGKGPDAESVVVKVDAAGNLALVPLDNVNYSKFAIDNAPAEDAKDRRGNSLRLEAITDLAYVDGRLLIAGLSNEEFASQLRAIHFPFDKDDTSASVEIYHGAHGAVETRAPVRTFVPFTLNGEEFVLAAYTCTPLVKFPLSQVKDGVKLRGTTVAELGNQNRPLDIVSYQRDGKTYLLLANSKRGVMKIATDKLGTQEGIESKVADTAGLPYETIADLKGVEQLDKLGADRALLLVRTEKGLNLEAVALP